MSTQRPVGQVHLQRMARSGGLSVVGAGVSAVSGVALVAIVTNGYPKNDAGMFFATTALFLIAASIVQLGTEVGLVRFLPAQIATGRVRDVLPTLRLAVLPVAALSVTAAVAGFAIAPQVAGLVAGEANAEAVSDQLRALAVLLPVGAVYHLALAGTRGFRTMRPTVLVDAFGLNLVQLAGVAAVSALGIGVLGLVLAWSVPYLLGLAAAALWLLLLLRRLRRTAGARGAAPPRSPGLAADFWRYTTPRAVTNVLQTMLKRSDIVLVAALRSPAEAALYTAATRFVVFGQLAVQALQQALGPQLSALFARDEHDEAQTVYQTVTAWSMSLAWPIYLACAVFAPQLLGFFGAGYADAAVVVVVLSLAMLFATGAGSVDTVLLMSGRSMLSLVNVSAALAVNIGLNLVLIPRLGIAGAAYSWALAIVLRNLLPLLEVRYLLRMSPLGSGTVWVGASALLCLGVLPGALALLGAPLAATVAAFGVGLVVYLGLLWAGRERIELAAFRGTLLRRGSGRPVAAQQEAE
ncbi:MAG: oligosaccharide flippase family protein [Actinomycetia bacterium]|nr:oligosaccharide flippase family protein [Actinomycetes bacterium]